MEGLVVRKCLTSGAMAVIEGAVRLDRALVVTNNIEAERWTLTATEQQRARRLGREVAEATEAVARAFAPGETEFEVAGRLAAAFWARGVEPTVLLVGGDQRAYRFRHPLPTAAPIRQYGLLAVCGRRHGLVVSATRLVHFGPPPAELARRLAGYLGRPGILVR